MFKKEQVLASLSLAALLLGAQMAVGREIPTAPENFLAMTNPLAGKKEAEKAGLETYKKKCAKCHGEKGDGAGKSAKDLNPPVTAFNKAGYLKGRKDGQLFWIIKNGSPKTDMDAYGEGTNFNLKDEQIWQIVAYMRSKFAKE